MATTIVNEGVKIRRPRKTIGEEGSRWQTLTVFLLLLAAGLMLYLPGRVKLTNQPINWPQWDKSDEVITIKKSQSRVTRPPAAKPNLETIIADKTGDFGVYARSVIGSEELKLGGNIVMTAASVIKLPVLVVYYQAVDQGRLDPEDEYILAEADRWKYGTGRMQYQPAGTQYTYRQVAQLVANQSDNMAAEVLIKKLGGYPAAQKEIDKLNLEATSLKDNEISVEDAGWLFFALAQGKLLTPASREELFNNLTGTVNENRIPAGVPDGVRVVHKFGSEAGVVNDCGIVTASNPYVICILTTNVNVGEVEPLLPQISAAVWEWLGD